MVTRRPVPFPGGALPGRPLAPAGVGGPAPVLRRPAGLPPALRAGEKALAERAPALPIARRALRIPPDALVPVRLPPPALSLSALPKPDAPAPALLPPLPGANDNRDPQLAPPGRRTVLREVAALALLVFTLAAFYYLGRMHAFQNVIVVPEPSSAGTRIG